MSMISKPSPVTRSAVIYVTVGALTVVWSGIWFFYLRNNTPSEVATFYWCYGFLLTGLTLMLIGLAIGWVARIGRVRQCDTELAPKEVSSTATQPEPTAVAKAPFIAVVNPPATSPVVPKVRSVSSDIPKLVPNGRSLSSDVPMYEPGLMSKKG